MAQTPEGWHISPLRGFHGKFHHGTLAYNHTTPLGLTSSTCTKSRERTSSMKNSDLLSLTERVTCPVLTKLGRMAGRREEWAWQEKPRRNGHKAAKAHPPRPKPVGTEQQRTLLVDAGHWQGQRRRTGAEREDARETRPPDAAFVAGKSAAVATYGLVNASQRSLTTVEAHVCQTVNRLRSPTFYLPPTTFDSHKIPIIVLSISRNQA